MRPECLFYLETRQSDATDETLARMTRTSALRLSQHSSRLQLALYAGLL
jgi:hypothetical protein